MKRIGLFLFLLVVQIAALGQDSTQTDGMRLDSQINYSRYWRQIPLYRDTLANDSFQERYFYHQGWPDYTWVSFQDKLGDPIPRKYPSNTWRYLVILAIMTTTGLVRLFSPGGIVMYFRSFLKPKLLDEVLEDQDSEISTFSILISFITALMYALPGQWIMWKLGKEMTDYPFGDYLLIALLIFFFIVARFVLASIVGRIFEARYYVATTIYTAVFLNFFVAAISILVFLILMLNQYVPDENEIIGTLALSLIILTSLKIFRSLSQAASSFPYSAFYLILYLCALELGPWSWVYILLDY